MLQVAVYECKNIVLRGKKRNYIKDLISL